MIKCSVYFTELKPNYKKDNELKWNLNIYSVNKYKLLQKFP